MAIELGPHEIRLLGVLIEKSMTQQAYYPMTLNAITAAANQKTNREPIMNLTEAEIGAALHSLQRWQLVGQAPPDRGSRANRFQHEVERQFDWGSPERAIMAELMLRGPQTVGELRGRASRMTPIGGTDYAREILAGLERCDPPMVVELAREPGRSATRFGQLLGGAIEEIAPAPVMQAATTPPPEPAGDLESRVAKLEQAVTLLRRDLDQIRAQPDGTKPDGA